MKELIENLPEAAKKDFLKNNAFDMIENFQATFNSLAICFAHAILHEPDMLQSQVENVRCSLIFLDEQLQELNELYLQTLKD